MSVTETDCGNIDESNHPYDVMPIQKLIEAADDAVSDEPNWHKRLIRELVWRIENEDNRDPKITALGSYYRFPLPPEEEEGKNNE